MSMYVGIPDFPGYTINKQGQVMSLKTKKILRHCVSKSGLHSVLLCKKGIGHRLPVAKALALAFLDNPNHLKHVGFKDKDPSNIILDNIYWSDKVVKRR